MWWHGSISFCTNAQYAAETCPCALLQALQVVVLSGSAVTESGLARLKRSRPQLLVKATGKKICFCQ